MKTIGLVGGTTWFSTIDYYRYINQAVNEKQGGDEAAEMVLYSVNYGEIKKLTLENNWDAIASIISGAAMKLEGAGATLILLGANTMHNVFDKVEAAVTVPLIHIADAVAEEIKAKGLKTVALLGTRYTMQLNFFKDRLVRFGITVLVPDEEEIEVINAAIYDELGKGILLPETKQKFIAVIKNLKEKGAEGVILGCTEIPLLIKPEDSSIPTFDTTLIHARAAVDFALARKNN
jgi:aspartate racemase